MASTEELCLAPEFYRCYHCGVESTESSFKYFDNKKVDQPRYQCNHCHKFFTLGSHGCLQGKTYAKKRNEDPVELKSLSRQCRHCGVADNALFKYYNNNNLLQPHFKCLSCGKQFQVRLLGTGEERHLVHTQQMLAPRRRRKQGVPKPFPNASSSSEDESYQPFDGSFIPVPSDSLMPLEPGPRLLPEMSGEDVEYSNFLEAELVEEENFEDDFTTWTGNGDDGNLLSPLSDEAIEYVHFLEVKLLTEENNEALNIDAFSSTVNVDGELPPAWSNKDYAELMGFMGTGVKNDEALDVDMVSDNMTEMVSKSTSSNAEVMYGTLVLDRPTTSGFDSWTWSHNDTSVDPSSMSYADSATACCRQMDMARENSILSVAPVQLIGSECSLSSVGSTSVCADSVCIIPEPDWLHQALMEEDEQCSDFHWNQGGEADEDMEMAPWTY